MGRSGSTMLQTMLDSHPNVRCLGELFIPDGPFEHSEATSSESFIEDSFTRQLQPVVGYKMPWSSLVPHPEILELFRRQRFRLILLTRRNKLDQYLSWRLAVHNNVWHSYDGEYRQERLKIDLDDCMANLEFFRFGEIMLREVMRGLPGAEIEYDDLIRHQGFDPIFKLLGVRPRPLTPGVARLRKGTQRDIIENYDEVRERLRGTPWEDNLED
jgi:hypothetical protein